MSSEFSDFVNRNGIRHVILSPYHPSSNGLAEQAVQTMKNRLKKLASASLEMKLAGSFLILVDTTDSPGSFTSQVDVWQASSQLDLLQPDIHARVQGGQ